MAVRLLAGGALLYLAWLGMMVAHEAGHVIHAALSGGRIERVSVPLAGFSQTVLGHNPRPLFVAWGGAIWGCVIPLAGVGVFEFGRWRGRGAMRFFAGFCLIANGAYIGVGWLNLVGDTAEMQLHGTPVWVMVLFGLTATAGGLGLWHTLGRLSHRPSMQLG